MAAGAPHRAIYVRVPTNLADKLDRVSERLGMSKRDVISSLLGNRLDVGDDLTPQQIWVAPDRQPEVLTLDEAAALLRVEPADVEELAENGEIPARRIGQQWRFSRAALVDWIGSM